MTVDKSISQTYKLIPLSLIDDPALPMRTDITPESVAELAQSIRENGIIEPLVLRPRGDRYEVIAGHRRFKAAHLAPTYEVPAVVRDADDRETTLLRVHENLIREDVNPVDEAIFIAQSIKELGWSPEQYAEIIKRSDQYVADRLAIAEMPDYFQAAIRNKEISLGVALWLNTIEIEQKKREAFDNAVRHGMTVRAAENWARYCESIAEVWRQNNTPESERVVPEGPPIISWPCAKCGGIAPEEELQFVRVHRFECLPSDQGTAS